MKRLVISFIIIVCITCSCTDKSKCVQIDIDLSKYESIFDLHQYSDSLKVIELETTQECLVSGINRIIEDDTIFIILDIRNKSVLIFHSSGKFYHAIQNWGKGPDEYIRIQAITVDKERDEIYVYDDNLRKLISYDYQGVFLSEMYLPDFLIRSFAKRKNGNFLAFTYDFFESMRDGIWEFDTKGNVIREYADIKSDHKLSYHVYPYFTRIDESYSFLNFYDNYIYTLDKDKLERKLKINIQQKVPDKNIKIHEGLGIENGFTGEYYLSSNLNETYNFYHFMNRSFRSEPGRIHVFIEKKTNQLIIADSLICDFEGYRNIQKIFSNDGQNFFGVLESSTNKNPALVAFNLKSIQ